MMGDQLFRLLRNERERLECEISIAIASDEVNEKIVRRLKALHRAVNDQMDRWMRDLYGDA